MARAPKAANEHRGEVSLKLDGTDYVLRPTYEAIVEVERLCGSSIGVMAMQASNLQLSLASVANVATEFIKAHGRATDDPQMAAFKAQRIGELILEAGMVEASVKVAAVLVAASTGGYTSMGNLKATENKTNGTSSVA